MSYDASSSTIFPRMSVRRSSTSSSFETRFTEQAEREELTKLGNHLGLIARLFEANPKKGLLKLKEILAPYANNDVKKHWISSWTDSRGLDLLQNAIISKRSDLIDYMLSDANLFLPSHHPKSNPYAHLAAYIGCKECLSAVLRSRPQDYFPASSVKHAVKLPVEVMKSLKLTSNHGLERKSVDRLVNLVKQDTEMAEHGAWKTSSTMLVEDTLRDFQDVMKDLPRSKTRKSLHYNLLKRQLPSITSVTSVPTPTATPRPSKTKQTHLYEKEIALLLKKKSKPVNKVTVWWDVFNDDTLDRTEVQAKNKDVRRVRLIDERDNKAVVIPPPNVPHPPPTQPTGRTSGQQNRLSSFSNQIELGIRKIRNYKEFHPVLEHLSSLTEDPKRYLGKTPLTYAAERKHYGSVTYLLNTFHTLARSSTAGLAGSNLTLAVSARSPEAIAILMEQHISMSEFQTGVLLALRELYPDSLNILLTLGTKIRANLFDGVNLYHTLYTQSLQTTTRLEMLSEMTRVLIMSKEDVNARYPARTFPMYTLIRCAFNHWVEGKSLAYISSLKMLLNAKANPNFDEKKIYDNLNEVRIDLNLSRPLYRSAAHCIFINAKLSINNFENIYWPQIIMQKLLETLENYDRTPRRVNNEILFYYTSCCCELGINRWILRLLLRYGANPNFTVDGKYPLNTFFEFMLPFMTKFQVDHKIFIYGDMVESLLVLCRAMTQNSLHRAVLHFLDNHFMSTPLQAMDLTRKFLYHVNKMITEPRSLTHLVTQTIWNNVKRNAKTVRDLPISEELKLLILP